MLKKVPVGLLALVAFSAAGYVWGTSTKPSAGGADCCILMKACCRLGSPCCDGAELPACTVTPPPTSADCCEPGAECCGPDAPCCLKAN
jgi:hypothetical protein